MPANKPEYQKAYHKKWYAKNRIKRIAQIRLKGKEYFLNFQKLKEQPCADCGNSFPYYCMDWDHLTDKSNEVSKLVRRRAWKQAKEEIKKCELVCANCHRIRTFKRKYAPVLAAASNG